MNFKRSIWYFFFLQNLIGLYIMVFCQDNERKPLLLTKIDGKFHLTRPNALDAETHIAHFQTPKTGKTYRFCSNEIKSEKISDNMFLYESDEIQSDTKTSDEKDCKNPTLATLIEVQNPGDLKSIAWNDKEMQLFHAGFLLYNALSDRIKKKFKLTKVKPDYGPEYSSHKFLVLVAYYYNKTNNQPVAAQYKLLSVNFSYKRNMSVHKFVDSFPSISEIKPISSLLSVIDSPQYVEQFRGKVLNQWMEVLSANSKLNPLSSLELASKEHFALPAWTAPLEYVQNYIPLWKIPKLMWIRVEIFARIVAKYLGDLQVTAGITGTMTLSNKEVIDKNGFKMPKYFWKAFQRREGKRTTGIIVVLNCNPFEKTEEKLCKRDVSCKYYGWMISNEDFRQGEVYCCEITQPNIENLKANFLSLKKSTIFNVKEERESTQIVEEYEKIISQEEYQIPAVSEVHSDEQVGKSG